MAEKSEGAIFSFGIITLILLILMLTITIFFFYFLHQKTGADFGLLEIVIAVIMSLLITGFLHLVKSIMSSNSYLGLILGLGGVVVSLSALFARFRGPNTLIFAFIAAAIAIIYLGFYFVKLRKNKENIRDPEIDEN